MFCVQHARTTGKKLTYDIDVAPDGSYLILLNDVVLKGGLPDPLRSVEGWWGTDYCARGIERATADIAQLDHMPEDATTTVRRMRNGWL